MSSTITPGLLILHGNQMEMLREAVFDWLRNHPLGPLEQETIMVQSNGFAEWLKIALARELGVCAATRVALPARFLWEAYRAMLGRERVPPRSPFDKDPLTWRLMRLLPALLQEPVFAPLTHFLGDGCPERRLQLAERLADLQRLQAEYVNYRNRVERDRAREKETTIGSVVESLIPVLDDIELARQHGDLTDGPMSKIASKLETTLDRYGVARFGEAGEAFDPNVHEALMHVEAEAPEGVDGTFVVQVLQPGYKVGERVVRAARVSVAG